MGRPINKRFLGSGTGNQIKVRAKVGSNAEGDGYIVSQRSTNRFRVNVGGNEGVCLLVNKSTGELADNEMIVNVLTDDGTYVQATKLFNRTLITEDNRQVGWNFATNLDDGFDQVADVEGSNQLAIVISQQPANASANVGETVTFSVAVTSDVGDLEYQWQVDEGTGFSDISGAVSDEYTTGNVANVDGFGYQVVISSESGAAPTVTSDTAFATVNP